MVIAFALWVHTDVDERVAFQEAIVLQKNGDKTHIISAYELKDKTRKEKMDWMESQLNDLYADVIVCDSPISLFVARRIRRHSRKTIKIVYDVTEWYPSKKNLRSFVGVHKVISVILMIFASLWAGVVTNAFLFGEFYKSYPFKILFFWKPYLFLPYYPSANMVKKYTPKSSLKDECVLYYSGNQTREKGFFRVLSVAEKLAELRPEIKFVLKVVSSSNETYGSSKDNLKFIFYPWQPFEEFCHSVGTADLFFDLRDDDFENRHCLPIKLFYYMAAGKPVVYSALKAIRKEVVEIDEVGFLCNPDDTKSIVDFVLSCIDNPEKYGRFCQNSLILSQEKYCWNYQEENFIKFMHYGI